MKRILILMTVIAALTSFSAFCETTAETLPSDTSGSEAVQRPEGMGGRGMGGDMQGGSRQGGMQGGGMQGGGMQGGGRMQAPDMQNQDLTPPQTNNQTNGNTVIPEAPSADNTTGEIQTPEATEGETFGRGGDMMQGGGMQRGDMANPEGFSNTSKKGFIEVVKEYSTPIISVILLIGAFFFVIFYRRKTF